MIFITTWDWALFAWQQVKTD